jgi:outer membrane protein TolC
MNAPRWLLGLALVLGPLASQGGDGATAGAKRDVASRIDELVGVPGGLTADVAAAKAVSSSHDLRGRHEQSLAAGDLVDEATVGYLPRATVSGRALRLSPITQPLFATVVVAPGASPGALPPGVPLVNAPVRFGALENATSIDISVQLPLSDYLLRISQAHAAAKHSEEAARLSELAARRAIATAARLAFYEWARARLQIVIADAGVDQAAEHLEDVRRLEAAGRAVLADRLRVEAQLASAQQLRARSLEREAVQREQLKRLLHDPKEPSIGENVRLPPAPLGERLEAEQLVLRALSLRPELRALRSSTRSIEQSAKALRGSIYPRLDAGASASLADPNPRFFPPQDRFDLTWAVGLQIGWSPNEALASMAGKAALEAQARKAEADEASARDALRIEVVAALEAVRSNAVVVESTASGLRSAEESYRSRRELFSAGRATSVELTDAETALTQARFDVVDAFIDRRIADARLRQATGDEVEAAP